MATVTIEDGIYAALTGDGDVSSYVGGRVYSATLPQHVEFPAIAFHFIASSKVHAQGKDSGVSMSLFQFDIYSESHDEAIEIREAVRALLQDFSGDLGSKGVTVLAVLMDDESGGYDNTVERYYQRMDFEIIHLQSRSE